MEQRFNIESLKQKNKLIIKEIEKKGDHCYVA